MEKYGNAWLRAYVAGRAKNEQETYAVKVCRRLLDESEAAWEREMRAKAPKEER